jgi:hypothetical protein
MKDITFPTRLLSFVKDIKANCAMGNEELEYIQYTAKKMLNEQIKNATDPDEIDYLERMKKI